MKGFDVNMVSSLSGNTVNLTQETVFSRSPRSNAIDYSTYTMDHNFTFTHDAGYLYPVLVTEVLPGDVFDVNVQSLCRLNTPVVPFMENLYANYEAFYVRNRLIMDKFVNLEGEQKNPYDSVDFEVPMLNSGTSGCEVGSIFDYMGVPPLVKNLEFSCLPFRAYNLIYNQWYRDENLQPWLPIGGTVTGSFDEKNLKYDDEFGQTDDIKNYKLMRRAKKHDYFTSSLPFQQKGPAVSLPFSGTIPVVGNGIALGVTNGSENAGMIYGLTGNSGKSEPLYNAYGKTNGTIIDQVGPNWVRQAIGVVSDPAKSGLVAELSGASPIYISDFRQAMQIQAIYELDARTGTRYKELVKGRFGVTIADATLDRPEYLGGFSTAFYTQPLAQTSAGSSDQTPLANLSAVSSNSSSGHLFTKGFDEHGWLIVLKSVTHETSYAQGLPRMFSRKSRFDFYEPLLAHISEQSIKNKEIYAQGSDVTNDDGTKVDDGTFGYQEAWAEYRYMQNRVAGLMRPNVPLSLANWNLTDKYEQLPLLNDAWLQENPDIKRLVAVQNQPMFLSNESFDIKATRPLPLYSVPSFLGSHI